jgi:hypothetical protein
MFRRDVDFLKPVPIGGLTREFKKNNSKMTDFWDVAPCSLIEID